MRVVLFKKGDEVRHKVTGGTLYVDHIMIMNRDLYIVTEYGDRIREKELINISWDKRNNPQNYTEPTYTEPTATEAITPVTNTLESTLPEAALNETSTKEEIDIDSLFADSAIPETSS